MEAPQAGGGKWRLNEDPKMSEEKGNADKALEEASTDDDPESELLGTWVYGDGSLPTKYTISRTVEGWLRVDERLPTMIWVYGVLQPQGKWLQTKLCSSDGTKFGTMRLRYVEEEGVIVSNVKAAGGASWGADTIGHREGSIPQAPEEEPADVAAIPEAEAPGAADLLSQFFDAIKGREKAPEAAPAVLRKGFFNKAAAPPPRHHEPVAIACSETAVTRAMSLADPLEPFGYTVKRLKPASGKMTCTEATPQGAPLLALPLAACWTAAAARAECPSVSVALAAAASRNPSSVLLRADHTWIALHLLQEKRKGESARAARKAHLTLLPQTPETLLSWSARDVEALHGSRWQEATKHRMVEVMTDFHRLVAELGPVLVADLGLDAEGYTWARQVIQQLGVHFLDRDGSCLLVVAPGLELLVPDQDVPPSTEGARLEFDVGRSPAVVVYATKDYGPGDTVALSHAGVACSNGFRLLGCGLMLEANPFEAVELTLKIPVLPESLSETANLWEVLEGLDAGLRDDQQCRPGDCLPPGLAEAKPFVEVVETRKHPEVLIRIEFSRRRTLPPKLALWYLGLTLTAHSERMGKIIEQERNVVNPLGLDACVRRSLEWLSKRIQWAIEDGPSRPLEDAERISSRQGEGTVRRVQALRLVAAERQLLGEVEEAIKLRLAEPVAPRAALTVPIAFDCRDALTAEMLALPVGQEPEAGSRLDAAVSQLRGCKQSLDQLAVRFRSWVSSRPSEAECAAAKEEQKVLDALLSSSFLEPMAVTSVSEAGTEDVPSRVCRESFAAVLKVTAARLEWEAAQAERSGQQPQVFEDLVALAKVHTQLLDFAAAQGCWRRCAGLRPQLSPEQLNLARTVALRAAARSGQVLGGTWEASQATLSALHKKFKDCGYMSAGTRWPWPTRLPPVENVAETYRRMWDEGSSLAKEARKAQTRVPSSTWWVMKETTTDLHKLIGLFVLQQPLALEKAVPLLGADACKLLLERSALSCFLPKECRCLDPSEAATLVSSGKHAGVELLSNVALWPADEEVIVAFDFDQSSHSDGDGYEPVIYLAEDSKAMLAAASRQPSAKRVLDVCCGSGAHGITSLKQALAGSAVFMDTNERSLRFAKFSTFLNGVQDRANFQKGSISDEPLPEGPFQAILAGLPFLPNPAGVMHRGGAVFSGGGSDGQRFLEALAARAPKLLAADGRATVTCMVKDVDGLTQRLADQLDAGKPAGFQATVFRGEPISLDRFVGAATIACDHALRSAYYRGLHKDAGVQSMSEALLLLWAPRAGAHDAPSKVDIRSECQSLWSNQDDLWLELERLLLATGVSTSEEPLYTLDWSKGLSAPEATGSLQVVATGGAKASCPPRTRVSKELKEEFDRLKSMDGATWDDIAQMQAPGIEFAPPILCNVTWQKSAAKLNKTAGSAFPHIYNTSSRGGPSPSNMILLELLDCQCPDQVYEALKEVGVEDRLAYDGNSLSLYRGFFKKKSGGLPSSKVPLSIYDILVIPLTGYVKTESAFAKLASEVLSLLQTILKQVQKRSRPMRIVLLTCGSIGPGYVDWHGDDVPSAAPTLGLIRAMRCEVPQLPVIWVDTDAIAPRHPGKSMDWLEQLGFELEMATPQYGVWGVSTQERALWMVSNNRDVAYRGEQRYLPKLEASPAMPLFSGREVPPMPLALARGPILITGGVGGLGLVAAEALAEVGAQHFVLSSRSGEVPKGLGVEDRLEAMRSQGIKVDVEKCDTGKEKDVASLLENLREGYGAPSVIIHTSGLIAEKAFLEMDGSSMKRVMDPKAQGASFLHRHCQDDAVGVFLMFSSTAALRGSKGQANYATANAYLDELARLRTSQGLPGISVQWPKVELSGDEVSGDKAMSVSLATAKQVIKQLVCGKNSVQAVQAVLPAGYLVPSTPILSSLLEPLAGRISNLPEVNKKKGQ